MKSTQSQAQNDDLKRVVERIVKDLEEARTYAGRLCCERILPPPGTSTDTPAGYPHLVVREERQTKLLGLIPHTSRRVILIVKEGFYDVEDKGRKDMFVLLKDKGCEAVAKRHLEAYSKRYEVTEVVFKA